MSDSEAQPFGPIRESDATGGWELDGDRREWRLVKILDGHRTRAVVRASTATTVAWVITQSGQIRREASARDIADAKASADRWLQKFVLSQSPASR